MCEALLGTLRVQVKFEHSRSSCVAAAAAATAAAEAAEAAADNREMNEGHHGLAQLGCDHVKPPSCLSSLRHTLNQLSLRGHAHHFDQ